MAHLPIISDEDAGPEAKVLFKHSTKMFGRVANAVRVASHSPKLSQAIFGFLVAALREEVTDILSVRTKTMVILKTSTLNGCKYWTGHNVTLGRALGFEEELIAEIEGDYENSDLFTADEKAAIKWAEVLTEKTYRENPQAMPELKKHFNEAQIVEISMVSGFFNFWNRFADGLQIDIEDDPVMNLFAKSTSVDKDEYVDFMRDCWWNEK